MLDNIPCYGHRTCRNARKESDPRMMGMKMDLRLIDSGVVYEYLAIQVSKIAMNFNGMSGRLVCLALETPVAYIGFLAATQWPTMCQITIARLGLSGNPRDFRRWGYMIRFLNISLSHAQSTNRHQTAWKARHARGGCNRSVAFLLYIAPHSRVSDVYSWCLNDAVKGQRSALLPYSRSGLPIINHGSGDTYCTAHHLASLPAAIDFWQPL